MSEMMEMEDAGRRRVDRGVPEACDCGAAVSVATSNDLSTRGKLYFSCPYEISDGPGAGCGFRRWWIPALCDEFAKLKKENTEMKAELEAAKERISDHAATIFQMELQLEEKEKDGEQFDAGLGVVHLMDKVENLEKKYEALERKYERLNRYL